MSALKHYCVDFPAAGDSVREPHTLLRGWVAGLPHDRVRAASLRIGESTLPVGLAERPDVAAALPGFATIGFQAGIPLDALAGDAVPYLQFQFAFEMVDVPLHLEVDREAAARFSTNKREKLSRILDHLQCPHCGAAPLRGDADAVVCERCGTTYRRDERVFDFLSQEMRAIGAVTQTQNVSANGFDEAAYQLIDAYRDGLILDAGSGLRNQYLPNVVNFEVVDYASTDVLGVCERLPFRNDTFDAVFSFAVLEHVRDPFQAAREIQRVLKPGGHLYAAVPFLQPFHGYPNHYYNMTSEGLLNLFPGMTVETSDVPIYGLPIWTLTWFLRSWAAALPPEVAADFKERKVGDLLGNASDYLTEGFVTRLPRSANEELACVNRLIARKPNSIA